MDRHNAEDQCHLPSNADMDILICATTRKEAGVICATTKEETSVIYAILLLGNKPV